MAKPSKYQLRVIMRAAMYNRQKGMRPKAALKAAWAASRKVGWK
jgi:hypothetical protein